MDVREFVTKVGGGSAKRGGDILATFFEYILILERFQMNSLKNISDLRNISDSHHVCVYTPCKR